MSEISDNALLDGILATYHLHARITDNMRYCGRWRDWDPQAPAGTAWFHLVDQGECWLRMTPSDAPVRLGAGDFVLLPRGTAHTLAPIEGPDGHIDETASRRCCAANSISNPPPGIR
jgi:hypothetical protein